MSSSLSSIEEKKYFELGKLENAYLLRRRHISFNRRWEFARGWNEGRDGSELGKTTRRPSEGILAGV